MIKRKKAKHPDASPSYWQTVWRLVRGNKRGMAGLSFVLAMLLVSIFSPFLATNQPIVCRYKGKLYFPAVVEIFQSRNSTTHWINK
jgi:ABC-type microcin C transport system permease subunit YejE